MQCFVNSIHQSNQDILLDIKTWEQSLMFDKLMCIVRAFTARDAGVCVCVCLLLVTDCNDMHYKNAVHHFILIGQLYIYIYRCMH